MGNRNLHEFQRGPRGALTARDLTVIPPWMKLRSARPAIPEQTDPVLMMLEKLLKAAERQANFQMFSRTLAANQPENILPAAPNREYFLVQNRSGVDPLFVGFGAEPSVTSGISLPPGGIYEPFEVPQNDVWLASTAAVLFTVIYAQ